MNPQNGQEDAKKQWALYLSYVDKEQRRMAAQQRRAQRIEEQRSKSVHQQINNQQPIEQSHFQEGPQQSYLGTEPEQVALPVEVKKTFQHPIIAKGSEDQRGKLQQQTINVEGVEKTSSVERHMRLTQLKREARFKKSSLGGKKNWKKLGRQKNKGDESRRI
ncbi:hypothetical protein AQUCO_00200610v1 [Aquilegia coerulea]|uniref:Uncharacterized protein n=1 Tax=Aquilegia coerulea TaxID=218851 RepID=A0A2G5F417_AQUCA|nr:hypothetical protein AQUCO_00200610v1 [Aquilegia coerulea]